MAGIDPDAILEAELRARRDSLPPSLAKATWQLLLGDVAESLETLAAAHVATPAEADPTARPAALALLAGDRDGARRHAARAVATSPPWVRGWREFHGAMLGLLARDEEAARRHVEGLESYARGHDRLPSGPPATVSGLLRGLLDGDNDEVAKGLDMLLEWHLRSARSRSSERFNSANGAICLDAIVALLIAHERGVPASVDTRYRRATLPALVVHVDEWNGQPLPRTTQLSIESDLVAGPWLAQRGLELGAPAPADARPKTRTVVRRPSVGAADAEPSLVHDYLRRQVADGRGSRWQLLSWSLMIGDHDTARGHLELALADARRSWEESAPSAGGLLGRFRRSTSRPNSSFVRAHFGLALAAGDEAGLRDAGSQLRAWLDAVEEDERAQGRSIQPAYQHVQGFLDYVADLLGPRGPRASADQVSTLPRHLHAASVGLQRGDSDLVQQALNAVLDEHAATLERRTSPPAPISLEALQIAAIARRRGLEVTADERYGAYPVPIVMREGPGDRGRIGRLEAHLMGRPLFGGSTG